MNKDYVLGFMDKCDLLKVDPEHLIKQSGTIGNMSLFGAGTGALLGGMRKDTTTGRGALTGLATGAGTGIGAMLPAYLALAMAGGRRLPMSLFPPVAKAIGLGAIGGGAAGYGLAHKKPSFFDKMKNRISSMSSKYIR